MARQIEELQVLRGLERLRPEWMIVLDGAEKWLYQGSEETYHKICEEFHKAYGSLGSQQRRMGKSGRAAFNVFCLYLFLRGCLRRYGLFQDRTGIVLCPLDTGISDGPMAGKWKETFHEGCGKKSPGDMPGK